MGTLVILSGPLEGQRVDVGEELTIGREQADLTVEDGEISRRHARLRSGADGLVIEDLGSSNGTRVDGKRINGPVTLHDGATVRLGQTTMRVELVESTTRISDAEPDASHMTSVTPGTQVGAADGATAATAAQADSSGTQVRDTPAPARRPRPRPEVRPAPPSPPAPAAAEFGQFRPSEHKRRRSTATRLWLPGAMTYVAIAGTAAGLIYYFAELAPK